MQLALVANARMPSQRAQSLQIAQAAAGYARAGVRTALVCARRTHTLELPGGIDLFDWYGVGRGPRPELLRVPCFDWIDRVPRRAQFVPARLQEWTFARNAAGAVAPVPTVISREIETAELLGRRGHPGVFCELHRLPGGRIRRGILRRALGTVKGWIAISGGVAEDLEAFGADPSKILVAHDALEAGRFEGLPTQAAARSSLGLDPGRPVVVYTGGLLAWKGVDLLVEAAARIQDVQFVIAGGMDADVARLRERAAGMDHVRIDGFQPPERVALYLAAADIGVVPNRSTPAISARYTSPLKVFEAMGAGLPLVASDLPSLRELLEPDLDGILVRPDDAVALAEGLARLLQDGELRGRMRARMRGRAGEHTWDARARRILDWIDEQRCVSSS